MRKLSIFSKLFLSIFLVASLSLLALGVLVYFNQKHALIERTSEQLKSVNILKKGLVEKRLVDDEKFIWNFIRKVMLHDTSKKFLPEKEFIRHKDFLKDFCKDYGHVDVMLLDHHEQAVDSLFEGNNYAESSAANGFTFVRVFLIDNSRYRLALISGTSYLQKLLFENTGMGNTGESYLVGADQKMISKSRFFPFRKPQSITVHSTSVVKALNNETGTSIIKDYRDINVLSAYAPVDHNGLNWVLLSEIDESEAMLPVLKLREILWIVSILFLIITFIVALYLSRIIVSPIRQVSAGMLSLSKGLIPFKFTPPFYENEESKMKAALNRLIDSFEGITNFASQIGSGNLKADFEPLSNQDILSKSLINMRDLLKEYREKEKSLRRQKALSLLEGQENERRRIAMDLHDGLGQWLTGIKLKIAVLDIPESQRQELKDMVSETINETRRITNNLMPNALFDFGLDSALRQMVASIQKNTKIKFSYTYNSFVESQSLPFETALTVYRIAQEALNNILKHADANNAVIVLDETLKHLELMVEDDGTGIPENFKQGRGLGNMEERAKLIGGSFSLHKLNNGTLIKVIVPVNR